jgi:hypothetical protein
VSSTEDERSGLNSDQRRDLRDCTSRLKETLRLGAVVVDLRRFLPPPEAPHHRAVLHELIKTELEACYSRHQGCLLEEFLRRYPELGGPEDLPASLLYEEYRVRGMFGDHPALDEYRARFPFQFEKFQELVRLHSPEPSPGVGRPITSHTSDSFRIVHSDPLSPKTRRDTSPAPPPVPSPAKPVNSGSSPLLPMLPGGEGYQLLERIGQGQFGEVYRGLAPGGVVVAIKRIFRSMDDDSSQRELKALHKIRELRHPFLLQTHNFQAFEDRLLIVMELADGSLQDRLKECRAAGLPGIPTEELLRYFTEAAEALDFLHQEKLSHRDIKPQNLLHLKGHAKVADFGIARFQENTVDHTLNVGGTPAYMPPEMWRGDISMHSDQYSLALTWYEMRTGRHAFPGKNQFEIAQQHLTEKPDVSAVPEAEQNVLLRALAKEPDQRFPTCVAFAGALREAMTPSKPEIPARGWGTKVAIGSLAFALTAILVMLYVVLWPSKVVVNWQPKGWEPEDALDILQDRNGQRYYRRLVHQVGPEKVVMVAVPQTAPTDPRTFYAMENKVWNDLYAIFMADPIAERLLQKYSGRPGCSKMVRGEWGKGGFAEHEQFLGVEGKGRLPVFRVTVTEAHCFAEWLDGRLPTRQQWLKAAGKGEDSRPGPFAGGPQDKNDLAVDLKDGPWPVDRGQRDVSIHGCRQMASNGWEWTRDLSESEPGEKGEIPLEAMLSERRVFVLGQSYLSSEPLTFQAMATPRVEKCTDVPFEVTFRVVLEQ